MLRLPVIKSFKDLGWCESGGLHVEIYLGYHLNIYLWGPSCWIPDILKWIVDLHIVDDIFKYRIKVRTVFHKGYWKDKLQSFWSLVDMHGVDLFYPLIWSERPFHVIQHTWGTVDLFYPLAPIFPSYDMPGIQWTYSIWSLSLLIQYAWYTVDLFYPRALSLLIQHAWYTVDLFYPLAPIFPSYDMPGVQWTYSIPGPCPIIRHVWDTVDPFYLVP